MSLNETSSEQAPWTTQFEQQRAHEINLMIADLTETAASLEIEIEDAESKSGITDPGNVAYPSCAIAFRVRLRKIRQSLQRLEAERDASEGSLKPTG